MIMFTAGFVSGVAVILAYSLADRYFYLKRMKARFDHEVNAVIRRAPKEP